MKRFLLLCLTIAFFPLASSAYDGDVLCLAVVEKNGAETYFAVDDNPIVTYEDDTMFVSVANNAIEIAPIDEIEMCYFTETVPSIDKIGAIATMDDTSAEFVSGKVLITGLKNGARVYVYTADGQTICTVVASVDGNVCVDLTKLKSGAVYILRTPSTSYKIINK